MEWCRVPITKVGILSDFNNQPFVDTQQPNPFHTDNAQSDLIRITFTRPFYDLRCPMRERLISRWRSNSYWQLCCCFGCAQGQRVGGASYETTRIGTTNLWRNNRDTVANITTCEPCNVVMTVTRVADGQSVVDKAQKHNICVKVSSHCVWIVAFDEKHWLKRLLRCLMRSD